MIFFAMMAPILDMSSSAPPCAIAGRGSSLPDLSGFYTVARSGERCCLYFFDLAELKFHRSSAAEDGDRDAHFGFLVIDFFDIAVEIGERAILDADLLAHFVQHFRP